VKSFLAETDVVQHNLEIDDRGEVRYTVFTRTGDLDIPWQSESRDAVLDPIEEHLIRHDMPGIVPGLLVWAAQGYLAGEIFLVHIPGGLAEGIFLTTILGGQGFHNPEGDVLYFDSMHWFRILRPERIACEVARYIATFPLFDRDSSSVRTVTLPSGRIANCAEIRAGVDYLDSVWNTGKTRLRLKYAAAH